MCAIRPKNHFWLKKNYNFYNCTHCNQPTLKLFFYYPFWFFSLTPPLAFPPPPPTHQFLSCFPPHTTDHTRVTYTISYFLPFFFSFFFFHLSVQRWWLLRWGLLAKHEFLEQNWVGCSVFRIWWMHNFF